jgi:hypothetical protein
MSSRPWRRITRVQWWWKPLWITVPCCTRAWAWARHHSTPWVQRPIAGLSLPRAPYIKWVVYIIITKTMVCQIFCCYAQRLRQYWQSIYPASLLIDPHMNRRAEKISSKHMKDIVFLDKIHSMFCVGVLGMPNIVVMHSKSRHAYRSPANNTHSSHVLSNTCSAF